MENVQPFKKILVAFDGSQNSKVACEFAAILAKGFKSQVAIVHVLPQIPLLSSPRRRQYEVTIDNKGDIEALRMESQLEKEGIQAKTRIVRAKGSVAESLVDLSNDEDMDLIVAGTRGLGTFRRMVLGSVSNGLLNSASCPILIVRNRPYMIELQIERILLATDGSNGANNALEYASNIAKIVGAQLSIVNVVYVPPLAYGTWVPELDKIYEDLRQEGKRIVSEASEVAKKNGVASVATKVIEENSSPVWAITKYAEEGKFDLIVLGTRGLGGLEKVLLGSVADGVVHYAKCSVLVTR